MTRKPFFFEVWSCFKFNNLGLGLAMILHKCGKRVKTKTQKVLQANSSACRSYRGRLVGKGGFLASPSWIGLKHDGTEIKQK